ncbi:hypothetical protein GGS23DRAFT_601267 [Durotheca rogersii]|uniref:uncharacterized protein n=1 Tax=Durotheca rogersii TaxID=419775 RepID=UPI00221FAFEC|nr:uncharacterized protein GGS23DRAFT_601267 [Durotheca rogersii]KAI5856158.1 hypothetical protein GGS23DRAFT_601267 [Durotheca rogersii]
MKSSGLAVAALWWSFRASAAPTRARAVPPAEFTANPQVGPGGSRFKDSPHFRVYAASSDAIANDALQTLESAYDCFVTVQGWRSPGLSIHLASDDGPWYKMNVYQVSNPGSGAAANMGADGTAGLSYLNVGPEWMNVASVTVHEFGHSLTYAERYWIDQGRTGAWWEPMANFVADTFLTSPACAASRAKFGQPEGDTIIDLAKVLGDAHQVLVDGTSGSGNYYEAWPFFAYIANNPDGFGGLGAANFTSLWRQYQRGSNETPLHVVGRLAAPATAQAVVARYWARMAYVDIGHAQARALFDRTRRGIGHANLDALGGGRYRVKAARQPRYMGANIVPLQATTGGAGAVGVAVSADAPFSAALAVRAASGAVRYVDAVGGRAEATLASGEEASLVVVNTPDTLYLYDPFALSAEVSRGLSYEVQITGATA